MAITKTNKKNRGVNSFISDIVAANAAISSSSVFSDMVWDRTEYVSRAASKTAKIHWTYLFDRHGSTHDSLVISLKEFAYALLFDPIDEDHAKNTKSIINILSSLSNFLSFLSDKHLYDIAEVDDSIIREYVKWLLFEREQRPKNIDTHDAALTWAGRRIGDLQLYYRYGKRVSCPLPINPLHGDSIFQFVGKRRPKYIENTTPVIPKSVWDVYLGAALNYVEIYSTDILCAQKFCENVRSEILPIYINDPNFSSQNFVNEKLNPLLSKLQQEFAINPQTRKPWRRTWSRFHELRVELNALFDACIVVIGCLSGMRESELSHLEVGGYWAITATELPTKRYRVSSLLTKGTRRVKEEWEVNEPVYKACKIVETLTSYARFHFGYPELFLQAWNLTPSRNFSSTANQNSSGKVFAKEAILPVGAQAFTRYLRRFGTHLDRAFNSQYRLPLVDDKPWVFVTRMLRRSLAGRIAQEPFGMIAGMLHYKHIKITTFAGYAGSDSGWLNDLNHADVAANDDFLADIWSDLREGALAGAKGEELVREFLGVAGDLKKDAHKYFIESTRANLHVGLFNYCLFQKDRALCLKGRDSERDTPIVNACHPDRCANSCITKKHLPQWQIQIDDAQSMLSHRKVTELQRIALSGDLEKAIRVVNRLRGN